MSDRPSFVEQMARLRALNEPESLPSAFPAHPVHGVLEERFVCSRCDRTILVGPCFDHLDPAVFVCGDCLTAAGEVETLDTEAVTQAVGQGGTGHDPSAAAAPADRDVSGLEGVL